MVVGKLRHVEGFIAVSASAVKFSFRGLKVSRLHQVTRPLPSSKCHAKWYVYSNAYFMHFFCLNGRLVGLSLAALRADRSGEVPAKGIKGVPLQGACVNTCKLEGEWM